MVDMLEPVEAEVILAADGAEALAVLAERAIDLAIIDLLFSGPVLSDAVIGDAERRGVSVITVSGILSSDTHGRQPKHPHLMKPFGPDILVEHVNALLKLRSQSGRG